MNAALALAVDDLLPVLTRDVIEAIADRPHESEGRRQARARGAMRLIEAFEPEDGVEIMLAGQTVLFQNLILDAIHDSRRATSVDGARRDRQQALAMVKVQLSFLKEMSRRRADRPVAAEMPARVISSPRAAAEAPSVVSPPVPSSPPRPSQPVGQTRIEPPQRDVVPVSVREEAVKSAAPPMPAGQSPPMQVRESAQPPEQAIAPRTAPAMAGTGGRSLDVGR
jgi:hypothetical protein